MRMPFRLTPLITLVLSFCAAMLLSCEPELDPDKVDPNDNPSNPNGAGSPSSDFLRLIDEQKVDGPLAVVANGNMTIDVKDTIYVVKDDPYMARVSVKHDTADVVSCFNIWVDGLREAYYYNIPVAAESNDSIAVFYVSMDPLGVLFTYSEKIRIQPCGSGGPMDEFQRVIAVEDPEPDTGSVCEIWTETEGATAWKWLFTQMIYPSGEIFKITAPDFEISSTENNGYRYGKCCWEDEDFGNMEVYPNDTTPKGICNDQNPYYHSVHITEHYTLRPYEFLFIFSSGNFIHYVATREYDFEPWNSKICEGYAHHSVDYQNWTKTGTHNYSPGASSITFTTLVADPPFGPIPPRGKVVKTCHLMLIELDQDMKYRWVYQRYPNIESDSAPDYWDNLDHWFE